MFAPMVPLFGFWLMLVVLVVLLMFPHESREVGMPPKVDSDKRNESRQTCEPSWWYWTSFRLVKAELGIGLESNSKIIR